MWRVRVIGTLVLAVALLATACGDTSTTSVVDEPEAPVVAEAEPAPATSAAPEEPSDTTGGEASSGADDAAPADPDDAAPADPDGAGDTVATGDSDAGGPADAEALLASATTQLGGRSARGEATIELAPGFGLSTSFESDAEGDLAATVEIPPGMDPEFPGGADAEVRYVGGVVYVRPPVTAEALAELGLDEAWFVQEPAMAVDPMAQAMGSAVGVMCLFPQSGAEPIEDCDPVGEAGAFLEAAGEPEIVGREDVRGVETTRVSFGVSLLDLAGEALGMEPDDDAATSGDGAFDDTASDPFAEGLDQMFGFLDAEFEVEVWIDDESLIRRLSFDLAALFAGIAGPEAEVPPSLITLEFYDFDADINVEAPPAEVIVDPGLIQGDDDYATSEGY